MSPINRVSSLSKNVHTSQLQFISLQKSQIWKKENPPTYHMLAVVHLIVITSPLVSTMGGNACYIKDDQTAYQYHPAPDW
jgi:hypothetical protein